MRNKLTKFLTSEYPPLGNKGIFAKTWKYAACMLLAFILGIGNVWADVLWESDMQASIDGVTQTSNKVTYDNSLSFAWAADYTKGLHFTGSSAYVNLAYSSAIELKEGDVIRFYTGCSGTSARTLSLFLNNGSSAVATQSVVGSILNVLEYKLTADLTLNSVKVTCGGSDAYLFKMYIYRDAPATGETTISCAFTYKGGDVKGWTNNCITTISGFSTSLSLVGGFATSGNNGLAGCSGEITGQPTTKPDVWDKTKYADIQFTIADGYTFTPTATSFKWSSNNSAYEAKIAIIDENNEIESNVSSSTGTQGTMDAFTFASDAFTGKKLSGSVHLRIYMRGANKRAWLGSPFTITGTVAAAAAVTKYTVTYDLNGGTGTTPTQADVAEGAKFTLHNGTTDITAPENKEFAGWNDGTTTFNGGAEYTMGSSNVTLTAQWQNIATKYAITYDLNGASGDAPTEASKAEGASFNLAAAPSRDGYRFDGWLCNIDGLVKAAESSYTMTAAATTFTAQWTQLFTVTYYNGAVSLGTEQVANGGSPANYGSFQTLPLASFVGWYSDQELNTAIADVSALTISANTPIYGKWNKAYAESIDFISVAGDYVDQLAAKNYALNCSDMTKVSYDNNTNAYDKGLKIKKNGTTLSFNVAAGKVVEITTGIISGATLSVNGGAAEDLTITAKSDASIKTRAYYSVGEQSFVIATTTDSYCIFKSIAIHDPYVVTYDATTNGGDAVDPASATYIGTALTLPSATKGTENFLGWYDAATDGTKIGVAGDSYTPTASITLYAQFEAISTDARLSAITFSAAGTLSPAFDPEVVNYTYTMPYGTTAVPTITGATKANVKGQEPVIDAQASAWGETAQVHGVAESGDTKNYFVTMKLGPKDGVCLVWGDIPSNNTITYNATNSKVYKAADVTLATTVSGKDGAAPSGVKFQNNSYVKVALNEGTFKAGDVLALDVTYGTANKMYVYNAQAAAAENVIGELDGTTTPAGVNKVAITDDAAELWLVRAGQSGSWNPHVDYVAVYRIMNPMLTAITINGEAGTINESAKTVAVELQPGYDLAALTIVPTIVSNTAEASVVKTVESNGGAWVIGDNTYRLTDKDGDYTEYTITLSVGEVKHIVSFNTHGGSTIDPVQVVDGQKLTAAPADPTKDENVFKFWSETEDGAEVDVTTVQINADKEFHAVWEAEPAGIKLINGDVVNHTNFLTGTNETTVEIESVEHKCVDFTTAGSNRTTVASISDLKEFIQYNATTNKAKIKLTLYNTKSSAVSAYLHMLEEGSETPTTEEISIPAGEVLKTDFYEFNSEKNRSFYITCGNRDYIKVLQVKVIDDGTTTLKKAGQVGYSVNTLKSRIFAPQQSAISFEGLTINANAVCKPLSTTALKIKNAYNISFHADAAMTLAVTTEGNQTYYVSAAADGTTNETSFTGRKEFEITAGDWYIHAGSSELKLDKIEFIAPKCAEPVIDAQPASKLDFAAGDMTASVTAHATDGGTLKYQWYKAEDDSEVTGATGATLTTTAEGKYYVIVTNTLTDHSDNSVKSDEATLKYRKADDATLSSLTVSAGTLAPAFDPEVLEYNVTLSEGTVDVPTLTATATMAAYGATADVTNATAFVNYEATSTVLVTAEDHSTQQTYTVHFYVEHTILALVDVTGDMTWDFSKDGLADQATVGTEVIMANVADVVNDANFKSDNIKVTANKQAGTKLQASMIMFHTTVDGLIKVVFSNTGDKSSERYLVVNGKKTDSGTKTKTNITYYGFVPAGDVVLTVIEGDGNMLNFASVQFTAKAAADLARDATTGDDWMAPGELGTICIPNGAVAVGGDLYTLEGKNSDGKIVFATVPNNKMTPGVPYLFQATSNSMKFYYTEEAAVTDPVNTGAMKGSFTNYTLTEGLENIYYFNGHALWSCASLDHLDVVANRAFVDMNAVSEFGSASPAPGRRYIYMGVHGQNAATDVDLLNAAEAPVKMIINGQLFILRGEKLYDATGRMVK